MSRFLIGTIGDGLWLSDDGDLVLAAAILGELILSEDGGRSWRRLSRRFTEIRAVLVVPS
jgi:hypothetical protein